MRLDETDFELLHITSTAWGVEWILQQTRFNCKTPLHFDHKWAYWFKDYPSYLLGREFLDGIKTDYQELVDEATGDFVLVTNYTSLTWQR
jgi:hypothetical protein